MAQYFEVLSQRDSSEENRHFFTTTDENQQPQQVRYILTDDSQTFQQQQLVQLSGDQVMLVDGSQQQVQQLVIESNQLTYQQTQNQAQPFMQMSNANAQTQQIFYMESSEVPTQDNVQNVIEPTPTIQPGQTLPQTQAQPIVLNHQLGASSSRQTTPQRPLLIRNNSRPTQINMANRPMNNPRPTLPQQVTRTPAVPMRANVANQMRMRSPSLPQMRAQLQQQRPAMQQRSQVVGIMGKDVNLVPQQQSQQPQLQPSNPLVLKQVQKQIGEFAHSQDKNTETQSSVVSPQQLHASQIVKPEFQKQSPMKSENVDELDDHDPSMNSNPAQMANYKRILEQKQQMTKMGLLSRLPSQIKITQTPQTAPQQEMSLNQQDLPPPQEHQQQSAMPSQAPLPEQQNQQVLQTGSPTSFPATPQLPQRKPRAPARPRNQNVPRGVAKPKVPPRTPQTSYPRMMGPQARFSLNQQQQQLANQGPVRKLLNQPQNQMTPQKMIRQQQQHQPQQINDMQQQHQTATIPPQSQINYLIPPPTPNRPRQQRPLPSYIPSSQIQQIIENTPITEEYSDSIRMLVLLENGEQRLITFTLPKEACTIQEILEQVNVPFTPETNIQVTEANTNGINYIVTVGNVTNFGYGEDECQDNIDASQSPPSTPLASVVSEQPGAMSEMVKPASPEPPKELPKLIPGKLAVCSYCGYTGEDFNRCARCNRKLPENVKSIDSPLKSNGQKLSSAERKSLMGLPTSVPKPTTPTKKKPTKAKPMENESVVISSDEEEDEKKCAKSVSEQLLKSLGASVTISPVTKEPSLTEIKKHIGKDLPENIKSLAMVLKCRTVRVGSYRFAPLEEVIIESRSVTIKAPPVGTNGEFVTLTINRSDIVKVLVSFNKGLPVVFYYLNVDAAPVIRETLNLQLETGFYYDPISEKDESFKKITLLPEEFVDEQKTIFQQIYGAAPYNIMDELTSKEANDILLKTCPKDGNSCAAGTYTEIKQILLYPAQGPGRLTLNTEDYVCLAVDQFLNDKIIDFYLKYLWENLPSVTQTKVHIFSTFFYKRLTTKPNKANKKSHPHEVDPNLTAAEKRHARVKNWTKKINLFEKDFIVVPINENAHWFLAIICFPNLKGMQTFDGRPYIIETKPTRGKKPKAEKPIPCDDPLLSDKDEAESEASDLESDDSDSSTASSAATTNIAASVSITPLPRVKKPERPPIKQPCILIFDSLAGPSRSRVVATLRDYLTVEYRSKTGEERTYNKDSIKGSVVKVPQQTNFTDCGLYLLQFVEHFFKHSIQDYYIPIKSIRNWFEEIIVTKKREDISILIKELMNKSNGDLNILPDIMLPTINGKIVEKAQQREEEQEGEDMFTDIEDSEMTDPNLTKPSSHHQLNENGEVCQSEEVSVANSDVSSPMKPSVQSVSDKGDIVATVMNSNLLRPTISEFPRITNKDTLNYLKAKRIVRHKQADGPEIKKIKFESSTK